MQSAQFSDDRMQVFVRHVNTAYYTVCGSLHFS